VSRTRAAGAEQAWQGRRGRAGVRGPVHQAGATGQLWQGGWIPYNGSLGAVLVVEQGQAELHAQVGACHCLGL